MDDSKLVSKRLLRKTNRQPKWIEMVQRWDLNKNELLYNSISFSPFPPSLLIPSLTTPPSLHSPSTALSNRSTLPFTPTPHLSSIHPPPFLNPSPTPLPTSNPLLEYSDEDLPVSVCRFLFVCWCLGREHSGHNQEDLHHVHTEHQLCQTHVSGGEMCLLPESREQAMVRDGGGRNWHMQ